MASTAEQEATIEYVTPEKTRAVFERLVGEALDGMTAEEFIKRWDAGTIEDPDRPEIIRLSMLLPFAR